MTSLLRTIHDPTLGWVRLAIGLILLPHGAQKLLGWFGGAGYQGTIGFFEAQMGIPPFVSLLVVLTESVGALMLVLGLAGRIAALAVIGNMIGAMLLVNFRNGFFWTNQGYEFPLLLVLLSAAVVVRGSGAWSLDLLLTREPAPQPGRVAPAVR